MGTFVDLWGISFDKTPHFELFNLLNYKGLANRLILSLKTKIAITLGSILLIAFILYLRKDYCKCKDRISYQNVDLNKEIDLDVLYTPTDSTELQNILLSWKNFSEESDTYQTVNKSGYFYNRNLLVVRHTVHGAKHYGAIVLPKDYDENKKYPLLVWPTVWINLTLL